LLSHLAKRIWVLGIVGRICRRADNFAGIHAIRKGSAVFHYWPFDLFPHRLGEDVRSVAIAGSANDNMPKLADIANCGSDNFLAGRKRASFLAKLLSQRTFATYI
jgi:hypothetical protein